MSAVAIAEVQASTARLHRAAARALTAPVVLAAVGALLAVRRAEAPYADTDILWGTRSGTDILSGAGLPHADSYSWTAHGAAWVPNSWGWNVLLAVAYRAAGYAGIAVLGILALAGAGALLGVTIRRAGAGVGWSALVMQICLGLLALFLYPRAQLADYAAVVAIPLLASIALDGPPRASRRAVIGLIAVQIVWMNLHSTAVLGPAVIAAVGLGRLVTRRSWRNGRRVIALVLATAAACLATPYGTAPITHLAEVRAASVGLISEWRPAGTGSAEQLLALGALVLGGIAALAAARRRAYDTVAVLLLFGAMTAVALRFAPLLMLAAIPPLALAARHIPARPQFVARIGALAIAVLAIACAAGAGGFAQPGVQNTSPALVAALPRGCRLVNDMAVGGAVLLARPDVAVSIDSRNDMYGRASELTALRVIDDPGFGSGYVEAHHVGCVLAPSSSPLVRALLNAPDWQVRGTDTVRTLLVRQ